MLACLSLPVAIPAKKITFHYFYFYLFSFSRNTLFIPRLQFRGEIDPGSDSFWNTEVYKKYGKEHRTVALEIEEEKVVLTKDQANEILEKLYRAG